MTEVDRTFAETRAGSVQAFTAWVRLVEAPLRMSLRRFAPAVDVEAIVQEALLRMWKLACGIELTGSNASLAYLLRLARNLAISEARRLRTLPRVDIEDIENDDQFSVGPAPAADPRLGQIIRACIEKLPERPREALTQRLQHGGILPDRSLARMMNMQPNTFLQNIVRARKLVAACLEKAGVPLKEYLS